MDRRDAGLLLGRRLHTRETGESRVENALMLLLFVVTLAVIVGILLVVGQQVHSVVSAVSDGFDQ
jgi:hypothetical protein